MSQSVSSQSKWLTVTEAAQMIGVGRNDMHRIPVKRHQSGQIELYLKSEIINWATKDRQTQGLLHSLRVRFSNAKKRQATRATPFTKTGKLKKRFADPSELRCPRCLGRTRKATLSQILRCFHIATFDLLSKLHCVDVTPQQQLAALRAYGHREAKKDEKEYKRHVAIEEAAESANRSVPQNTLDYLYSEHGSVFDSIKVLEKLCQYSYVHCSKCDSYYYRGVAGEFRLPDSIKIDEDYDAEDDCNVSYDDPHEAEGACRNGVTLDPMQRDPDLSGFAVEHLP